MNTYRFRFAAQCPSDNQMISYRGEIRTRKMIMVEDLIAAFPAHGYHETIADDLYMRFGGHQTISAMHQGIEIETVRR